MRGLFGEAALLLEFLSGLAIARLRPRWEWGVPLGLGALLVWAASPAAELYLSPIEPSQWQNLLRVMWWGVPAAAIVYAGLSLERFAAHSSLRPAVLIGDASYSLYLFHVLAMVMFATSGLAGAFVAIAAGLAIHRYVEKPLLRLAPWNRRGGAEPVQSESANGILLSPLR